MDIKLIIFDLDGVLVDAKLIHFSALNKALGRKYEISWNEHLSIYDGLKTYQKLEMLTKSKGLPVEDHEPIWKNKQKYTLEMLESIEFDDGLYDLFKKLKNDGYIIGVCSNSIRVTVSTVLFSLNLQSFIDIIYSNEDVRNSKPHPEMYWRAISDANCLPEETLIIEDSPNGLLAAKRSYANVLRVKNPTEVTYNNIINKIYNMTKGHTQTWLDPNMNVVIPMAGAGSRFEKAGYTFPKPLIDVNGKPMIQRVVENLNIYANYIYIVQKSHREKYNLDTVLKILTPKCTIIEVEGITEGAACTALLSKEYINNENPLFFANSDQVIDWNSTEFLYKMNETDSDGGIVTFHSTHPKWSYAKVNEYGLVSEVAEKNPISNKATVGYYYWKHGSDFVKYAEQMIDKDIRVNNEFYVCPVFNEAVQDNKEIRTFHVDEMWGLGTPEDLNNYLINHTK